MTLVGSATVFYETSVSQPGLFLVGNALGNIAGSPPGLHPLNSAHWHVPRPRPLPLPMAPLPPSLPMLSSLARIPSCAQRRSGSGSTCPSTPYGWGLAWSPTLPAGRCRPHSAPRTALRTGQHSPSPPTSASSPSDGKPDRVLTRATEVRDLLTHSAVVAGRSWKARDPTAVRRAADSYCSTAVCRLPRCHGCVRIRLLHPTVRTLPKPAQGVSAAPAVAAGRARARRFESQSRIPHIVTCRFAGEAEHRCTVWQRSGPA